MKMRTDGSRVLTLDVSAEKVDRYRKTQQAAGFYWKKSLENVLEKEMDSFLSRYEEEE